MAEPVGQSPVDRLPEDGKVRTDVPVDSIVGLGDTPLDVRESPGVKAVQHTDKAGLTGEPPALPFLGQGKRQLRVHGAVPHKEDVAGRDIEEVPQARQDTREKRRRIE